MSVTANVTPALCASLHAAWDRGDLTTFATLRDLLHPLNVALFVESNPIPLKAALAELGLCRGELRLPLLEMNSRGRQHLVSTVEEVMPAEEAAAGMVSLKTASLPLTRGHAPARCR